MSITERGCRPAWIAGMKRRGTDRRTEKYKYVYTYTDSMGTKTISIMDDVYGMLKVLKAPDESFSDEIRRLAKTKGSLMEFAGAWSDLPEETARLMKARIKNRRNDRSRLSEINKNR